MNQLNPTWTTQNIGLKFGRELAKTLPVGVRSSERPRVTNEMTIQVIKTFVSDLGIEAEGDMNTLAHDTGFQRKFKTPHSIFHKEYFCFDLVNYVGSFNDIYRENTSEQLLAASGRKKENNRNLEQKFFGFNSVNRDGRPGASAQRTSVGERHPVSDGQAVEDSLGRDKR